MNVAMAKHKWKHFEDFKTYSGHVLKKRECVKCGVQVILTKKNGYTFTKWRKAGESMWKDVGESFPVPVCSEKSLTGGKVVSPSGFADGMNF